MAIDARHEEVFPLSQAYKRAEPLIGKRLAQSTFYRWASRGVKGIRLETRFLGVGRYTSTEALQRFFDRLTEATDGRHEGTVASESPSTGHIRREEVARADRELDMAGI